MPNQWQIGRGGIRTRLRHVTTFLSHVPYSKEGRFLIVAFATPFSYALPLFFHSILVWVNDLSSLPRRIMHNENIYSSKYKVIQTWMNWNKKINYLYYYYHLCFRMTRDDVSFSSSIPRIRGNIDVHWKNKRRQKNKMKSTKRNMCEGWHQRTSDHMEPTTITDR